MAFESLTDRLAGVFKKLRGHGKLTEADIKAAMREVRMALLEADVNYKVAKDFCAKVSERAMGQEVMESLTPAQQVVKIVNEELVALMGGEEAPRLVIKNKGQTIIMLCGLQGNGKTTHAAKLAKYYIKQGRRPMLVACDIYRPAAIDQLQVVGKQAGAPVFTLPGEKPPAIAKKALAHAKDYGNDIIILDTAGRLQIDEVLMQELVQIKEAVPVDETLLVVDAMAGQDAVNVAKTFNETVGIDGIILTKTDGDTRGGAALSVLSVTGKPIKFQGTGEKLDDLEVFHPSRMASRILGMGDVLSLIERAQDAADEARGERIVQDRHGGRLDHAQKERRRAHADQRADQKRAPEVAPREIQHRNIDEKVQNTGDVHPCGQLNGLREQCSDDLAQSDYAAGVEAHRYDEKVHAQRVEECCENRDQDARPFVLQRFVQHSSCPHFSPH